MALSKEEIQAFNQACRNNFQIYNQRIRQIEQDANTTKDHVKILKAVKQIQRELAEKGADGRPKISLFDFKDRPTRRQFFDRLNKLFGTANQHTKNDIRNALRSAEDEVASGNFHSEKMMDRLKSIRHRCYTIPKSDPEKKEIERQLQSVFASAQKSVVKSFPELDQAIKDIEKDTRHILKKIRALEQPELTWREYFQTINTLKEIHTQLKRIQKEIQKCQGTLGGTKMDSRSKNSYWLKLKDLWAKQSDCWNEPNLSHRSNFLEELTSSNFQKFSDKLEDIENKIESDLKKDEIKTLHRNLKSLESELRDRDDNNFKNPLKSGQMNEFFGRIRACKQRLNDVWNGIETITSETYERLDQEIKQLYGMTEKANSKHDLEKVKTGCKELHQRRKAELAQNKLTPGQNHRLRKLIDELWADGVDMIKNIAPQEFSYDWLIDAYQRNIENRWVIFVKEVPPITT